MFAKIVRLILLRDLMRRSGCWVGMAAQDADVAARFVLKGEVPPKRGASSNAG